MTSKLKVLLKKLEPWPAVFGLVAAIGGGILGADAWVKKVARDAILDERFLATLATRVRPICIFDTQGAIEADLGAMEYIEDIHVTPLPKVYGYQVVIKAKRHLAYAPVVTGLDRALFPQSSIRGKLHEWTITLEPASTVTTISAGEEMRTKEVHHFKIEILH